MRVEFDHAKDTANQVKHGVSLAMASELEWEAALVWVDVRRIISLRRANRREVKYYVESL